MQFEDLMFEIPTHSGNIRVRVAGDAFHVLWGEGLGPQTEVDLLEANMAIWETIAADKIEAGADPRSLIEITALDVED